jgi:hypothetical protein
MKNMLIELLRAREKKIYCDNEFENTLLELKKINAKNQIKWDVRAGEEWAFLNNPNLSIMLNRRIGICFIRGSITDIYLEKLNMCNCVYVNDFSTQEWFINLDSLKNNVPEIIWPISNDGVNPKGFSLDEFYFETV